MKFVPIAIYLNIWFILVLGNELLEVGVWTSVDISFQSSYEFSIADSGNGIIEIHILRNVDSDYEYSIKYSDEDGTNKIILSSECSYFRTQIPFIDPNGDHEFSISSSSELSLQIKVVFNQIAKVEANQVIQSNLYPGFPKFFQYESTSSDDTLNITVNSEDNIYPQIFISKSIVFPKRISESNTKINLLGLGKTTSSISLEDEAIYYIGVVNSLDGNSCSEPNSFKISIILTQNQEATSVVWYEEWKAEVEDNKEMISMILGVVILLYMICFCGRYCCCNKSKRYNRYRTNQSMNQNPTHLTYEPELQIEIIESDSVTNSKSQNNPHSQQSSLNIHIMPQDKNDDASVHENDGNCERESQDKKNIPINYELKRFFSLKTQEKETPKKNTHSISFQERIAPININNIRFTQEVFNEVSKSKNVSQPDQGNSH